MVHLYHTLTHLSSYQNTTSTQTLSNKSAPLKQWLPLAKEKSNWQTYIDNYFKICRKTDSQTDNNEENEEGEN